MYPSYRFSLGVLAPTPLGLTGNGHRVDWEIYDRPDKGSRNGFAHFAVQVEEDDRVLDARALQGDLASLSLDHWGSPQFRGHGLGPRRKYPSGLPHFQDVDCRGEFPMARGVFRDETFPGQTALKAFSPCVPLKRRRRQSAGGVLRSRVDQDSGSAAALYGTGDVVPPIAYSRHQPHIMDPAEAGADIRLLQWSARLSGTPGQCATQPHGTRAKAAATRHGR